jgi:hypothetical protein
MRAIGTGDEPDRSRPRAEFTGSRLLGVEHRGMMGQAEIAVRVHAKKAPQVSFEEISAAEAVCGREYVDDHEFVPLGGPGRLQVGDAVGKNRVESVVWHATGFSRFRLRP